MSLLLGLAFAAMAGGVIPATDAYPDLKKRADAGDVGALVELGIQLMDKKNTFYDPVAAETLFHKAADAGNVDGQYLLGEIYNDNVLGYYDKALAYSWFEKAAQQGQPDAVRLTCRMAFKGRGVAKDAARTVAACRRAAEKNEPIGMAVLGLMYVRGERGTGLNDKQALGYLVQADAAGEEIGSEGLGVAYFKGKLVTRAYGRSLDLFRKALGGGEKDAGWWLGQQYENGLGVTAEAFEAGRLYFYAGQSGNAEARAWLARHPEVTNTSLGDANVNWFDAPQDTWTIASPKPDGSSREADFRGWYFNTVSDYFPEKAVENEVEGRVEVDCHWNAQGDPDNCIVTQEQPDDYGFAEATLKALANPLPLSNKAEWIKRAAGHNTHMLMVWAL